MSALSLRSLLVHADKAHVDALCSCWRQGTAAPRARAAAVTYLASVMGNPERVEARLKDLPGTLSDLLEVFLREPERASSVRELAAGGAVRLPSQPAIEAAVVALSREGFVFPAEREAGDVRFAVPRELADCIERLRREQMLELQNTITLRGFLQARRHAAQAVADEPERDADHARKVYKIYLMQSSIESRVRSLPANVRAVLQVAVTRFGGLMPTEEMAVALEPGEQLAPELLRSALEEAMLGTVAPLRLARYGIKPWPQVVVVFHEVTAAIGGPAQSVRRDGAVDEVVTSGDELPQNAALLLREVAASKVQFTVEGHMYKASEKRISKSLLPVPRSFLEVPAQMRFVYRFCLTRRLLDRSGERSLRPTELGAAFDRLPRIEQVGAMLGYAVDERGMPGEDYHQIRLRRILLRLLASLEAGSWYDLRWMSFLARNTYLSRLDNVHAVEHFATRFKVAGYLPSESAQQMCFNLVRFAKRRLFPLGILDLGLRDGRPVGLRVSPLGVELLGALATAEGPGSGASGPPVWIYDDGGFHGRDPAEVERLLALPQVAPLVQGRRSATTLILRDHRSIDALQKMAPELGVRIERRCT